MHANINHNICQLNFLKYVLCRIIERKTALTHAEASLAAEAVAQGRGLIIALNKIDKMNGEQYNTVCELVREKLEDITPEIGLPVQLPISALNGDGTDAILPSVLNLYSTWNKRVSTGKLNAWLQKEIASRYQEGGGKEIQRVKYLSQVKARPPSFVAFVSGKAPLSDTVQRFLANRLRDDFGLQGVPVRVIVRRKLS